MFKRQKTKQNKKIPPPSANKQTKKLNFLYEDKTTQRAKFWANPPSTSGKRTEGQLFDIETMVKVDCLIFHGLVVSQSQSAIYFLKIHFWFYNFIVPLRFLLWEIRVAFPGKASCDRVALPNLQ